mmetsp:Transcript_2952/g.10356  ORF Transcript_2952/g.10356 Transcript_2952/m.10356 type:complete len:231 (+) Transcript_2952:24-716(+)
MLYYPAYAQDAPSSWQESSQEMVPMELLITVSKLSHCTSETVFCSMLQEVIVVVALGATATPTLLLEMALVSMLILPTTPAVDAASPSWTAVWAPVISVSPRSNVYRLPLEDCTETAVEEPLTWMSEENTVARGTRGEVKSSDTAPPAFPAKVHCCTVSASKPSAPITLCVLLADWASPLLWKLQPATLYWLVTPGSCAMDTAIAWPAAVGSALLEGLDMPWKLLPRISA